MSLDSQSTKGSLSPKTEEIKDVKELSLLKLDTSVSRARSLVGNKIYFPPDEGYFYLMLARCESILRENNVDFTTLKDILWEKQNRVDTTFAQVFPKSRVDAQTYDVFCDQIGQYRYKVNELSYILDRLSATKEITDIYRLDKEFKAFLARFKELSLRRGTSSGEFPPELLVKWLFKKLDKSTKQVMQSKESYKNLDYDAFRSDLFEEYESRKVLI